MKYLLIVLVVAVVFWAMASRRRSSDGRDAQAKRSRPRGDQAAPMLACVHCGVHLPREDAVMDAAGRAYCSREHRLAGPR
ncbi:MAG TPA: PP0621 family protein [Rubrivivax sp.]|nr:hypothetical protein [Burkholderiales bacterium]HNT38570.1 PP0621 family protein [Rubrivivax sp.]